MLGPEAFQIERFGAVATGEAGVEASAALPLCAPQPRSGTSCTASLASTDGGDDETSFSRDSCPQVATESHLQQAASHLALAQRCQDLLA